MKVLAVLWILCVLRICSAGCLGGGTTDDNKPITLDIANPDESKVDILRASRNEVEKKEYYPKDTSKITTVVDGGVSMWTASGDEKCCFARSYTKGDSSFLYITIKGGNDLTAKFCEKAGGAWNEVDEEPFNDRVTTMIGGAVKYTSQFGSKVNGSLFNALDSFEDNVKVLKLTPKKGAEATKLTFGGDKVWEDKKKSCLSALFYMDGERPTLAVLVTRDKNNKQGTVYRYHDGKQWKDGKEEDHKKNLNALKTEAKNHPIAKQQPAQLAPQQAAKPNTQAAPQGPPGQTQAKPVESPEKESTESKELSQDATTPVPQSSEHVNTTLDISKREDTNVGTHYYHSTYEGPVHDFKLKSATVTKVVDAGVVIWEAPKGTNHKCTWAQITVKNGKETLRLEIQTGKEEQLWFRKRDGKWRKLVLGSSPQKSPNPTSKSHTN